MINPTHLPRRKKSPLKTFHPCLICKEVKGFTWSCECHFAFCTDCLEQVRNIGVIGTSHRIWICPDCGREHPFAVG